MHEHIDNHVLDADEQAKLKAASIDVHDREFATVHILIVNQPHAEALALSTYFYSGHLLVGSKLQPLA